MKFSYRNQKNAEAMARLWGKSLDKPDWYQIKDEGNSESAEILIYDVIGWPFIDAGQFVADLARIKAQTITVRINSPGGDVFDGAAIFNALKNHQARIVTRIEGLAASIASIVALSGDEVQAHANTMYMIHDSWVLAIGNKQDLKEIADILSKIDSTMVETYKAKTGLRESEITEFMRAATWFTAKEAKAKKFVDTILDEPAKARAQFDLSMYANAPDELLGIKAGRELTSREIERALRDAGATVSFAKAVVAGRNGRPEGDLREVESLKDHIRSIIGNMTDKEL